MSLRGEPADKGEGVVILNKDFYNKQLIEMLADDETYKRLDNDPTLQYSKELEALVEYGYHTHVLTIKEKKYLALNSTHIPIIYTLLKIHKDPVNTPARIIVNRIGYVTARLGQYLDRFLQKSVVATKAYLSDTKNLLQLLEQVRFIGSDVFLVTSNIISLYCDTTGGCIIGP